MSAPRAPVAGDPTPEYLAIWRGIRAARIELQGEALVRRGEDFLARVDPDRYGWMTRFRPSTTVVGPTTAQRRPVALPAPPAENYNAPFSRPGRRI
jgi:hypothetical protein